MVHLDLFSGIGGFAYAIDQVWDNAEHIFCDNDKFCREVLKKHWPESEIYDDIRAITNTRRKHGGKGGAESPHGKASKRGTPAKDPERPWGVDIVTGGFPCQPFSSAGSRRGTSDDRYLWPEMLRVIRLTKPTWVIAENVRGLLTLEQGVVFEQVCADLEASGYEVQPFIIPAVAVNAPHRRDRIWFIAYSRSRGQSGQPDRTRGYERPDWAKDWLEVAAWSSRVDDGLPNRSHRLKALGNAIVPQVAIEIMKGINNGRN